MDKVILNKKIFNLAQNGLQMMGNDRLILKIASSNFNEVQDAISDCESIQQTLADGTKVAVYNGFTKIISIKKEFDQRVGYNQIPREVESTVVDEETGEDKTVVETVWDNEPIMSDVIEVTVARPTVEETVAATAAEVSELQMMLKDMLMGEEG